MKIKILRQTPALPPNTVADADWFKQQQRRGTCNNLHNINFPDWVPQLKHTKQTNCNQLQFLQAHLQDAGRYHFLEPQFVTVPKKIENTWNTWNIEEQRKADCNPPNYTPSCVMKHLDPQPRSKILVQDCYMIIRRNTLNRQQCQCNNKTLTRFLICITLTPSQTLHALTFSFTFSTAQRNTFNINIPPTHYFSSNPLRKTPLKGWNKTFTP